MPDQELVLDFNKIGGPVYTGRERAVRVRSRFCLDAVDKDANSRVRVLVPSDTYSIASSFFLGLFGDSVRAAGSKEAFFDKYRFEAPGSFMKKFEDYAERALRNKGSLV